MKEFIVVCVALALLIVFPIQGLIDAAFDAREQCFDSIVRSYAEKARLEGRFTPSITADMVADICERLPGLAESDLIIEVTTEQKYRSDIYESENLIVYRVTMPLKNRFIGGAIFGGIGEGATYTCAGSVSSEALP